MLRKQKRRERRERTLEQQRARAVHLGYMEKGAHSLDADASDEDDDNDTLNVGFNIVNRDTDVV